MRPTFESMVEEGFSQTRDGDKNIRSGEYPLVSCTSDLLCPGWCYILYRTILITPFNLKADRIVFTLSAQRHRPQYSAPLSRPQMPICLQLVRFPLSGISSTILRRPSVYHQHRQRSIFMIKLMESADDSHYRNSSGIEV